MLHTSPMLLVSMPDDYDQQAALTTAQETWIKYRA